MFKRNLYSVICQRVQDQRRFIQVILGPRQVGKTTLVLELEKELRLPVHYASADSIEGQDRQWLYSQWEVARIKAKREGGKEVLLILDEIQKIPQWSEVVKQLWDEDTRFQNPIKVILLGSAQLLIQKGMSESLAGRFEVLRATHWAYREMKEAFGWNVEQYLFFGGYPGASSLISDPKRWKQYLVESLIETTLSKDILQMTRVDKPVLLRNLFHLGCGYSGQILSYQKILGQLQDAGNTTTLAHYVELLQNAGLLAGLQKYSSQMVRQRSSSPKWQVFNTALLTSFSSLTLEQAQLDREFWGRLVESAVGATLLNQVLGSNMELFYWREQNEEVDFIVRRGEDILPIEVKSGLRKDSLSGIKQFCQQFSVKKSLCVGTQGMPLEEFLLTPVEVFFD